MESLFNYCYPEHKICNSFAILPVIGILFTHSLVYGGFKGIFVRIWLNKYYWIEERKATLAGYYYERCTPNVRQLNDAKDYLQILTTESK